MCTTFFFFFLFFSKLSYSARTQSALKGQSCQWLSDSIIWTYSASKFMTWSSFPDCHISSDCVPSIYNVVSSKVALTSMVISVTGSNDWLSFPLFFGQNLTIDAPVSFLSNIQKLFFKVLAIITPLFGLALYFFKGLGRHTGRKVGSSGGEAKSFSNQTQHLRWPNGRKCLATI